MPRFDVLFLAGELGRDAALGSELWGDVGVFVVVGDAEALGDGGRRTGERDDELDDDDDVDRRRVGDLKKVTSFVENKTG